MRGKTQKTTLFKEIAGYITEVGLEHTTNGSYYAFYEEIADKFQLNIHWIKNNANKIYEELDFDIVAECSIEKDSFGMTFYLQYCCEHCERYKQGKRNYENCSSCDCWCDSVNHPPLIEVGACKSKPG